MTYTTGNLIDYMGVCVRLPYLGEPTRTYGAGRSEVIVQATTTTAAASEPMRGGAWVGIVPKAERMGGEKTRRRMRQVRCAVAFPEGHD